MCSCLPSTCPARWSEKTRLASSRHFVAAFGARRDVVLVLKFTNAEYDPPGIRELYRAAEGINVVLRDGYMARDELAGLMAAADCYISLHRSEGFGLGIAEAMALGKPVIATEYSGPADFLTPANSYPVDYRLVPIPRDYGPYLEGFTLGGARRRARQPADASCRRQSRGSSGPWTPGGVRHRRAAIACPHRGACSRSVWKRSGRAVADHIISEGGVGAAREREPRSPAAARPRAVFQRAASAPHGRRIRCGVSARPLPGCST